MKERQFLLVLLQAGLTSSSKRFVVPENIDWELLISEADRQGVSVLASDGLQRLYDMGLYSVEDNKESRRIKARWFGKTIEHERRYLGQCNAAKRVGEWFSEEGIRMIVLKGLTVSECYPIPSHRFSADLDCFLICDGEHFDAYEKGNIIIENHGIKVNRSYYKNSSFDLPGLHVENHRFCTPFRGNPTLHSFEQILQRLLLMEDSTSRISNLDLYRPSPLFSALFLTEHAYSHFLHEGLTLRHLIDWYLFRNKYALDVDWALFHFYCTEYGFDRFLSSMNHVSDFIMGEYLEADLEASDIRFLNSVWHGPQLHSGIKGFHARLFLIGNMLRAGWKYRSYSNISMFKAMWISLKGYLFIKHPSL